MPSFRTAATLVAMTGAMTAVACGLAGAPARAADTEMTVAMITHGQPGDTFWDIIRKGAQQAAANDHVKLIYLANPTASGEAQLVTNVLQQHVDGIALTLAFPDAETPMVKKATEAGVPVVGFNAGGDNWKQAGMLEYVGQDEDVAGQAVGSRLNDEGVKSVVCVDQQQGAVQLEARCDGIKKTFKGTMEILYVPGYDMAAAQSRMVAKLQQDTNVGYIVTLGAPFVPPALTAIQMSGSKAKVGTFDLTPRAVGLVKDGSLQWAVDQQPYAEGYYAVDLLYIYKHNGNTLGGGGPVLTGPAFVTKQNIDMVAAFAKGGTR